MKPKPKALTNQPPKRYQRQVIPSRPWTKVDLLTNPQDHLCALMAANGASTQWITNATGLTAGQVHYRLRKAGLTSLNALSRRDYRNGNSVFCGPMLKAMQQYTDALLLKHLEAHL